jgi:hypothetical protein
MMNRINYWFIFRMVLISILLITIFPGCATFFNKKMTDFKVTSNPTNCEVFINDSCKGVTPLTVKLKSKEDYLINIRKEKYLSIDTINISKGNFLWFIPNLPLYYLGISIDILTNEWQELDYDSLYVELRPIENDFQNPSIRDDLSIASVDYKSKIEIFTDKIKRNNAIYLDFHTIGEFQLGGLINYEFLLKNIGLRAGLGFELTSKSGRAKKYSPNAFLLSASIMFGKDSKFNIEAGTIIADMDIYPLANIGYKYLSSKSGLFFKGYIGFPTGFSFGYAF